ncbi:hypothetical protein [Roseateles sp.]|uniref:hypothetical protein n=1 Tax=Roseateles sp. TaxID=1971397 RepID=UPI00326606C7
MKSIPSLETLCVLEEIAEKIHVQYELDIDLIKRTPGMRHIITNTKTGTILMGAPMGRNLNRDLYAVFNKHAVVVFKYDQAFVELIVHAKSDNLSIEEIAHFKRDLDDAIAVYGDFPFTKSHT